MFLSAAETLVRQRSFLARVGWQSQILSASSRQALPQPAAPINTAVATVARKSLYPSLDTVADAKCHEARCQARTHLTESASYEGGPLVRPAPASPV